MEITDIVWEEEVGPVSKELGDAIGENAITYACYSIPGRKLTFSLPVDADDEYEITLRVHPEAANIPFRNKKSKKRGKDEKTSKIFWNPEGKCFFYKRGGFKTKELNENNIKYMKRILIYEDCLIALAGQYQQFKPVIHEILENLRVL